MSDLPPPDVEDIQDADEGTELKLGAFPNPSLDDCPITFLGFHGKFVVFAMPEGEIRIEKAADIGRMIEVDIYNSPEGRGFMGNWRDRADKFQRNLAVVWFVRQCRAAGYWDTSRPQRGLGVWPGEDGEVILHAGERLFVISAKGKLTKRTVAEAMRERGGVIWRLRAPAPEPQKAASAEDGAWAKAQLDLWRFDPIGEDGLTGADIVAGWLTVSLLGAVAPFRPHVLLYTLPGGGKTTLIKYVHSLLSALAGDVIDSFTPAGLRNDLAGMARPVIIDEAEASPYEEMGGAIEGALDIIRKMATGSGATRKMGDIGGGSVTQTAVGSVLMAAVSPVKLSSADASRIAECKLSPLSTPPSIGAPLQRLATDSELDEATERAKKLAPHLLGRALSGTRRYLVEARAMKDAFVRQGQSPRSADLVAALAAGRRLLITDEALTPKIADDEALLWRALFEAREDAAAVSNVGQDCLNHLFAWPSGFHSNDRIMSIGELIRRRCMSTANPDDEGTYDGVLREFGLKLVHEKDPFTYKPGWSLLIANNHPSLAKVYAKTPWRDWRRVLSYLDSLGDEYRTSPSPTPIRYGLVQSRALKVPLTPWLGAVT